MRSLVHTFVLGLIFLVNSCDFRYSCPEGYDLHPSFASSIDKGSYCKNIAQSLEGDSIAFNKLMNPPVSNGLIIDHANIIAQVIRDIGKDRVCFWIYSGNVDSNELYKILRSSTYNYLLDEREQYFTPDGKFKCD